MSEFQILNFIISVIYNTPLYRILYLFVISVLLLITFFYIFSLHFVIIRGDGIKAALRNSKQLMVRHWPSFLKDFVLWSFILFFIVSILIFGLSYLLLIVSERIQYNIFYYRAFIFIIMLFIAQILSIAFLLTTPVIIHRLTTLG